MYVYILYSMVFTNDKYPFCFLFFFCFFYMLLSQKQKRKSPPQAERVPAYLPTSLFLRATLSKIQKRRTRRREA